MGNWCPPIRFRRRASVMNPKNVTLLLVGLDNAGKTTIAKRLSEEPLDGVHPTVGFSKVSLQEKGCQVTIYDLGGGPSIRDIWPRYYADVHGVIFVIDASDTARMTECRKALEGLLLDSYICGKPVLLLANKQDVDGALDEIDIVDRLNVERLVNQQKCPTLVELCSARHFSRKMDVGIDNGYRWLLRCISKDYPSLNNRVLKDSATQEELERIKRVQREERIKKTNEERERQDTTTGVVNGIEMTAKQLSSRKREMSHPNGFVKMVDVASLPGQIEDEDEDGSAPNRSKSAKSSRRQSATPSVPSFVSHSCDFFNYERDTSDLMLIQSIDDRPEGKNFLVRPKSSGARISTARSDAAKRKPPRRKSYQRNNKTAPSPFSEVGPLQQDNGPIPKVFDPAATATATTTTTTTVSFNPSQIFKFDESENEPSRSVVETVVQVENPRMRSLMVPSPDEEEPQSRSMPASRKSSKRPDERRCSSSSDRDSSSGGLSRLGKLPPLRTGRGLAGRELILDVTTLN